MVERRTANENENRLDLHVHVDTAPPTPATAPDHQHWAVLDRLCAVESHLRWMAEDIDRITERLDLVYRATLKAGLLPPGGCRRAKPRGTARLRSPMATGAPAAPESGKRVHEQIFDAADPTSSAVTPGWGAG